MLTRMTDEDWEVALEVFRAVRSRRGDKGRDDRRFLEALHYFTLQNGTWATGTRSGSGSGACARAEPSTPSSRRWPR
jgi:hypothetical protein